jgi:hypothetical protein
MPSSYDVLSKEAHDCPRNVVECTGRRDKIGAADDDWNAMRHIRLNIQIYKSEIKRRIRTYLT